jgi:hypothetical protein
MLCRLLHIFFANRTPLIGDSFAEWLAYGLEQVFAETPQIGIVRKIKTDLGPVRDDARLDAPEWMQTIKELLLATDRPNAIVVMLGVNDRSSLRERAPAAKETTSPSDHDHPTPVGAGAQRQPRRHDRCAQNEGRTDHLGGTTGDPRRFEGQTRRLRTYDGVYFIKAGAEKLGHYVEHELRRVLSNHVLPVALPGPEEQSPAKDAVGPVLPLNATGTEKSSELLGAAKQPAEREANPLAERVLNRGEATVAPRGRADDFSWPRSNTSGEGDMEPTADAVRPRGSGGTSELDQKLGNAMSKPEVVKSGTYQV